MAKVKFIDVDPAKLDTMRGRVSQSILEGFIERNSKVSKLDLGDMYKNPNHIRPALASYVKNHDMPIKVFTAGGQVHLMRLDIDDKGNAIKNWQDKKE